MKADGLSCALWPRMGKWEHDEPDLDDIRLDAIRSAREHKGERR